MKDFQKVIQPRFEYPDDPKLEHSVNRVLDELTRRVNDTIATLINKIPRDHPLWAEGEEVTLQCNKIFHSNATELAVRHNLGVKPTRYIPLMQTVNDLTIGLWGMQYHNILPTESPWTDTHAYFYASQDAIDGNTTFKILLLP